MDWLRQVPIGQYVDGSSGWLRYLDPRLKFAWVLMFLVTPVLAGAFWRVGLVIVLLLITFLSGLPVRIWWRSLSLLLVLGIFVGFLALFLPAGEPAAVLSVRAQSEFSNVVLQGPSWEIFRLGPFRIGNFSLGTFVVDRRSAELGIKTSTLIITVVQSVNLMLLTTESEDLVWSLSWFLAPLSLLGVPVNRLSFQLLLALRFLPLVQEELQNLLRSLATRAVSLRRLGLRASVGLILSVAERLLANILLRAEQGAEAMLARDGSFMDPNYFRSSVGLFKTSLSLNLCTGLLLIVVLGLRQKYGGL